MIHKNAIFCALEAFVQSVELGDPLLGFLELLGAGKLPGHVRAKPLLPLSPPPVGGLALFVTSGPQRFTYINI